MAGRPWPGLPDPDDTVVYDFNGRRYSTSIHDGATLIHRHSHGRGTTNQQPCATVLSDGTWVVCWTQATYEAAKDESVVASVSRDGGATWSEAFYIQEARDERTASWGMLLSVPHTSRVYCFYWWNENAFWLRDAGTMYFRFSDDHGATWSDGHRIALPRHKLDIEGAEQHGWNTGFPVLTADGAMLLGYAKINPDSMTREVPGHTYGDPDLWYSEVFFLRCPNILTEDDPEKLVFHVTPEGDTGIYAPHRDDPERNFCQEPYMAVLPDGRIIATMRTRTGFPYYTVSADNGQTWRQGRPLRIRPGGPELKHPCGPCPITCTRDGRVIFLFRNDNAPRASGALCYWDNRDPHHVAVGRCLPDLARGMDDDSDNAAIYFDAPRKLLTAVHMPDDDPCPRRRAEYPQLLQWGERFFAVYSSKKVDMMVKEIPAEMFAGYGIPSVSQSR